MKFPQAYDCGFASRSALTYHASGQVDEASPLYEQTLAAMRDSLGSDHQGTLGLMGSLATGYYAAGRVDEAIQLFEQTLTAMREKPGVDHPGTQHTMHALAWILATAPNNKLRDGRRALERATEACELADYKNAGMLNKLAAAYAETGNFESAVNWSERSLELLGNSGSAELRDQYSRALANYKADKPTRQGVVEDVNSTAANDDAAKAEVGDAKSAESDTPTEDSTGKK